MTRPRAPAGPGGIHSSSLLLEHLVQPPLSAPSVPAARPGNVNQQRNWQPQMGLELGRLLALVRPQLPSQPLTQPSAPLRTHRPTATSSPSQQIQPPATFLGRPCKVRQAPPSLLSWEILILSLLLLSLHVLLADRGWLKGSPSSRRQEESGR